MMKMKKQMMKVYTAAAMKALQAKQKIRETSGEGYVDTRRKDPDCRRAGCAASGRPLCPVQRYGSSDAGGARGRNV